VVTPGAEVAASVPPVDTRRQINHGVFPHVDCIFSTMQVHQPRLSRVLNRGLLEVERSPVPDRVTSAGPPLRPDKTNRQAAELDGTSEMIRAIKTDIPAACLESLTWLVGSGDPAQEGWESDARSYGHHG
jgi:hypothetical protein